MQNVLADLALESEAATVLALRLAAAVDAGETDLLRVGVPVAKYWLSKRVVAVVAEALECLGGNGYVEEHGLARLYRDAPLAALWEGTGNVTALDVLRAMSLQPRSMEVLPRRGGPGPGRRPAARPGDGRGRRVPPGGVAGGPARPRRGRGRRPLDGGAAGRRAAGVAARPARARRRWPRRSSRPGSAAAAAPCFGTLPVGRRGTQAIVERALPA